MALVSCGECGHQVSTEAAACPGCGAPVKAKAQDLVASPKKAGAGVTALKWAGGLFVGFVVLVLYFGSRPEDAKYAAKRKAECLAAIQSGIGHSTKGYADKVAYDAELKDKCDGFEIDGKPVRAP